MSQNQVFYEATPNPQAMKFVVTRTIADESAQFQDAKSTARSPLAHKIFGFPWAAGVHIGTHFVTVTKQDWVDWQVLAEPLAQLINEHLELNLPVLLPAHELSPEKPTAPVSDDPVVQKIMAVIEEEIRPAVAMDGGDVVFSHYEGNRVYLRMQGSCNGCPSASLTLKEGIETRLKAAVPEIVEVIAI